MMFPTATHRANTRVQMTLLGSLCAAALTA